jgi:hypothetical protein
MNDLLQMKNELDQQKKLNKMMQIDKDALVVDKEDLLKLNIKQNEEIEASKEVNKKTVTSFEDRLEKLQKEKETSAK